MSSDDIGAARKHGLAAPGDAGLPQKDDEQKRRWQRLMGNQWTVTLAGGIIVAVVGGLLVYFLTMTHRPATPAPAAAVIPTGYYVSGSPGTPHYFILVSTSHGELDFRNPCLRGSGRPDRVRPELPRQLE